MADSRDLTTRRKMLAALGSTAFGAGCSGLGGEETTPTRTATSTGTPTDTPTATETETATDTPTAKEMETATETETETSTPETEWTVDPLEHDKMIGAHYYAWYRDDGFSAYSTPDWTTTFPDTPELGEYRSHDHDVINQHIKWAVEHGINWFIAGIGPRNGYMDRVLQNDFMAAELADYIDLSTLIGIGESQGFKEDGDGRTDFDKQHNRDVLTRLFGHLQDNYFDYENHHRIDGRPSVYIWNPHGTRGDLAGAFEEATENIGENPYLIANPLLESSSPTTTRKISAAFDGFSEYSPYIPENEFLEDFLENVEEQYRDWVFRAERLDADFIPTVLPGVDSTMDPRKTEYYPPLKREKVDFAEFCNRALKYMDPELEAVIITSFNEFPEYTSIEPTEGYGEKPLNTVRSNLAQNDVDLFDKAAYPELLLDFNRAIKPQDINDNSSDDRPLALMLGEITVQHNSRDVVTYNIGTPEDEPIFAEGAYGPVSREGHNPDSWRWLGGPTEQTAIYLHPQTADASEAELVGKPMISDELSADIYYVGRKVDSIDLGQRSAQPNEYTVSLR